MPSTETVFPWGRRAAPSLSKSLFPATDPPPTNYLLRINSRVWSRDTTKIQWLAQDLPKTCPRLRLSDWHWSQNQVQYPFLWFSPLMLFLLHVQILSIATACTHIGDCRSRKEKQREGGIHYLLWAYLLWLTLSYDFPHLENLKIWWEKIKILFNNQWTLLKEEGVNPILVIET